VTIQRPVLDRLSNRVSIALMLNPAYILDFVSQRYHFPPCPSSLKTSAHHHDFPRFLIPIFIMRIFDVYEHPSFEVDNADKVAALTILRRFGVGFTLSATAAIGFCMYYWSDLSSPSFFDHRYVVDIASARL
jgi:hypothetical protein